ncbi:hypothetical protein O1611_g4747 [Lasiodiplodia mahajangana]|uniref:Uncharacterized protein n=1 Tax=Lasiodiplodia mahajangana TaxID=1108764 RepID=A0ACC2JN04_9PEZI|nr:hypothetical protein O1611_g4747 [Lasiodiplodia mahajangana]
MYLECGAAAVSLLLEDQTTGGAQSVRKRSLVFEELHIDSPLGIDPAGEVVLRLGEIPGGEKKKWKLTVAFSAIRGSIEQAGREIVHAEGILSFGDGMILSAFNRLVSRQMQGFVDTHTGEKLHRNRAYKLFGNVMKYDTFYMGIQSVQMNDHEAVVAVEVPESQPQSGGNKSRPACDAVILDMCMHATGLLINTGSELSINDVAVMVGLEQAIISPHFKMDDIAGWKVFASTSPNDLVALFSGIRLTRLPISKLEKVFSTTSRSSRPETITGFPPTTRCEVGATPDDKSIAIRNTQHNEARSSFGSIEETLKDLVAECTMVEKSEIPIGEVLAVVGPDSLGSAELSEELLAKFKISVSPEALLDTTLVDLQRLLGAKHTKLPYSTKPLPKAEQESFDADREGAQVKTKLEVLFDILTEYTGARRGDIKPDSMLAELGVDSLSLIDLRQEVEQKLFIDLDLKMDATVSQTMNQFGISSPGMDFSKGPIVFTTTAQVPFQDEITVAYILEAFATLGVDLKTISAGAQVPKVPYVSPKYDKLIDRCWQIPEKRGFISIARHCFGKERNTTITRGKAIFDIQPASQLLKQFEDRFPNYHTETRLMALTGQGLASCLSGDTDLVSLMFGSPQSLKIMEDFYGSSPLAAALTEQLVLFLNTMFRNQQATRPPRPVRILEVGGGAGGTTRWLAKALDKLSIPAHYTHNSPGWDLSSLSTTAGSVSNKINAENERQQGSYRLDTMVYKEVDGVQIHAHVYFPKVCPLLPMPIGPVADVLDAYQWVRDKLPNVASKKGIRLDPSRVVAIGWSTGGQLAMSLGWTTRAAAIPPPKGVLSFYAPVDVESGELDSMNAFASLPKPILNLDHIIRALPLKPVTSSNPGDLRSDLLITLAQERLTLPALFNGLQSKHVSPPQVPTTSQGVYNCTLIIDPPTAERVASISPLAQLGAGHYTVPTFIIHGTKDEVVYAPVTIRTPAPL